MSTATRVTLLPLAAGLHLRWPRYNAAVMEALLRSSRADALALEPFPEGFEREPQWRDHDELLVPWVALPWARRHAVAVHGVHEPSPEPGARADLERYLSDYAASRALLDEARAALRTLPEALSAALTLPRILDEVVPLLEADRRLRLDAFGDGPGTDWSEQRAARVAQRVTELGDAHVVVLVGLDRYVSVREALRSAGARLLDVEEPPVDDAARERALLDLAWRGDGADVGALVAQLRQLGHAEARFHAAGLLLAHDHPAEALEELEACLRLEFAEPWFLPGALLARLGQLRDLAGQRERAVKAYRGVMALEWAPAAALEAARAGLHAPFELGGSSEA